MFIKRINVGTWTGTTRRRRRRGPCRARRSRTRWPPAARCRRRTASRSGPGSRACPPAERPPLGQILGGLVLGCIKMKICQKICVWQHFSSSTKFAYFCTAAISFFSKKSVWKISIVGIWSLSEFANFLENEKLVFFVNIQQHFCKCRKICKILPIFKNFS